jgi:DNA-binding CsgD family transcriptional regulator
VRSVLALCEGRFDEAERWAEDAGQWGHLLPHAVGGYGVQIFEIRREQGRLQEVRRVVETVGKLGREGGAWGMGLAAMYGELGMLDEAAALLPELVADDLAAVPRDSLWCGSLTYLADAAVATGDRASAAAIYPMIQPYRGLSLVTPGLACYGAADRYLGTLAVLLGRPRDAATHLEAAVAFDEASGAVTWAAHSQFELGRFLARRGARDDTSRARALLGQALGRAEAIGMARLESRCREELARLDVGEVPPLDMSLTARELEVLRLVAEGRTNREIGAALHMSQHTAANHVRAILLKTGCSNRTEAASLAMRRGLLTTQRR